MKVENTLINDKIIEKLYCKGATIDDKFIKMTNLEYHCYIALQNHLKREPTINDFKECNLEYYQCDPKFFSYKDVKLLQFETNIIETFENNKFTYQKEINIKILT